MEYLSIEELNKLVYKYQEDYSEKIFNTIIGRLRAYITTQTNRTHRLQYGYSFHEVEAYILEVVWKSAKVFNKGNFLAFLTQRISWKGAEIYRDHKRHADRTVLKEDVGSSRLSVEDYQRINYTDPSLVVELCYKTTALSISAEDYMKLSPRCRRRTYRALVDHPDTYIQSRVFVDNKKIDKVINDIDNRIIDGHASATEHEVSDYTYLDYPTAKERIKEKTGKSISVSKYYSVRKKVKEGYKFPKYNSYKKYIEEELGVDASPAYIQMRVSKRRKELKEGKI